MSSESMTGAKRLNTIFWLAIVIVLMLIGIYIFLTAIAMQKSEENFSSDGYGRPRYGWKFGDKRGSLMQALKRCQAENPQGCELLKNEYAAKCKPGFELQGNIICRKVSRPTQTTQTTVGAASANMYSPKTYEWKLGDRPDTPLKRCLAEHSQGCDRIGSGAVAKCMAGYQNMGAVCKKL